MSGLLPRVFVVMLLCASLATAQPATTQSAPNLSPAASDLLAKVKQAYTNLQSLQHTGKISGEFDVDGQQEKPALDFTSSFAAPNLFRFEIDNQIIGSDGQHLYAYLKTRGVYHRVDAPKARVAARDLPDPFAELIHSQDPALGLAISLDPAAELVDGFGSIENVDDVKLGDDTYSALKLTGRGRGDTTMLFDQSTHLLRRITIDLAPELLRQGAAEVKKAVVTIDYPANKPNATTQPQQFAWAPPASARDLADVRPGGEAEQLVGKPAPAFKLKDLNDKDVSLASLKGKVVVLEFWATTCPACMFSLPKFDEMAKTMKDGVAFFAVNQGEDKELAQGFMASKNMTVPVLLDTDLEVSEAYLAHGIPQVVVIGKDGMIRKVFIGYGPNTDAQLRDAINAALHAAG